MTRDEQRAAKLARTLHEAKLLFERITVHERGANEANRLRALLLDAGMAAEDFASANAEYTEEELGEDTEDK